ncbi:MAG: hypothetical protein Q9202_004792 [Teloschistes flavicans]
MQDTAPTKADSLLGNPTRTSAILGKTNRVRPYAPIGLPASEDVGYLAEVHSDLRAQVEKYRGAPIEYAGFTTPHLIALYQEDLQDALDYVGLRYLSFPVRYDELYETSAAYADYGYGLYLDYTDRAICKQQ